MSVRLKNIATRPVWLVLGSGESLRLAPGQTSDALADVEVNDKVKTLAAQGVISQEGDAQRGSAPRRPARRPKTDANP